MKLEKRKEDPFAKSRNLFKMGQFKTVAPIVNTKRGPFESKANYHSREGRNKHLAHCLTEQERKSVSKQLEHRQKSLIQSNIQQSGAGHAGEPQATAAVESVQHHNGTEVKLPAIATNGGASTDTKACCH